MHAAYGSGIFLPFPTHLSCILRPDPRLELRVSSPPTRLLSRMALLERQVTYTYVVFDDQGPGLWNNYVGNWTRYSQEGFFNHTFTATPTPGSSVSLNFSGA